MTTRTLALTGAWAEAIAGLGLVAGTDYSVVPVDGPVEVLESVSQASPDASARGRPLWPGSPARYADTLDVTPATGRYLWVRALSGRAVLVADDAP